MCYETEENGHCGHKNLEKVLYFCKPNIRYQKPWQVQKFIGTERNDYSGSQKPWQVSEFNRNWTEQLPWDSNALKSFGIHRNWTELLQLAVCIKNLYKFSKFPVWINVFFSKCKRVTNFTSKQLFVRMLYTSKSCSFIR